MTNQKIYEKIHEECRLRALSTETEESYIQSFRAFLRFYDDRSAAEMNETHIRSFLFHLAESGIASGTINIKNSGLRFVFGAILDKTLNYQKIPRRKIHRELPIIMSKIQITKFFSVIDNLRDKAMFETAYGAGLRISEIASLRIKDIDSKNMRIFVHHGKGGKDRYTLLSQRNPELLREYWKAYHPPEFLFYSRNHTGTHIHKKSISDAFRKYLKASDLPDCFTVHTLRHCFATHLLESGVDVCRIKQLMGHTHIQSTTFYLHLLNFDGSIKSPLDTLPKKRGRKPKLENANV